MKSFFKKLAFVMAMAMVVSLAAPAAANAATSLYAAIQDTTAKVDSLTLTTGEEIDLCFIGAPKGWRDLERGWKVTKGDAVTVDQNGVIKAVKAGEATVEFYMSGCESAVVTVKVTDKKEGYLGYTQTSTNAVQFGFGSSVAGVKKDNVTLYRVFETAQGDVEVYWPIDSFKADGNTITVSPFVMFGDGEQYRIKINGETYDFTTVLPELDEITYVQTTFGTDAAASNGKAEVSDEDSDYECEINLGYKLMYNTMDVTALFADLVDIEFVLVSPDPNSDADILDEIYLTDSTLILTDKVDVVVKATAVYDDEDGNTVEIASIPATIAPEKKGAYDFKAIVDWCLYSGSGDVNWNTKSAPAGEAYSVILLVEDTYGDLYVTNPAAVNAKKGYQAMEDSRFETAGFSFKYYSTNTDLFLIDETDADITTYKEATLATVYVALHQDTDEEDDKFIGNKYAFSFKITEPAKLNKFTVSSNSIKVLADAIEEELVKNYVTITAKDQNDATWKESFAFDVTIASGNKVIEDLSADAWEIESKENGTTILTLNGAVLYADTGKTSFKVTVKEVNSGLTTSFSVSLTKPNWKDRKTEYAYTNFEEGIVSATKNEYIANADRTDVNKLYTILIDQEDKQNKLTIETSSLKLTKKTATVTLYKTSNGEKVGYHDATVLERSNPTAWKDTTGNAVGDRFYALYFNGKVVNEKDGMYAITTGTNGKMSIAFATKAADGKMTYATAGTYTLSVYTVTAVDANGKITKYATKSADIKVTDDRKSVALDGRTEISTTLTDEAEIVLDAFSFTLGGKEWTPDTTVIDTVDYTSNGQYMIIKSVTFKVPVKGGKTLATGEEYYTQKVTVNMSVKLAD